VCGRRTLVESPRRGLPTLKRSFRTPRRHFHEANRGSRPGELYELGPHRLLCADETDPAQLAQVMAGDCLHGPRREPHLSVAPVHGPHPLLSELSESRGEALLSRPRG
jgi:hypothetical protein